MVDLGAVTAGVPVEVIRQWLVSRVAFYLELPESAVDPDAGLVEMGFDSVYALTLSGDVEDEFGLELEPTIAWDHRTVNALAARVSAELANR